MKDSITSINYQDVASANLNNQHQLGQSLTIVSVPLPGLFPGMTLLFQGASTVTYIQQGQAVYHINMREYLLQPGDMLIVLPGQITQMKSYSDDFQAISIIMSQQFTESLHLGPDFQLQQVVVESPLFHLNDEAANAMLRYVEMVKTVCDMKDNPYQQETVYHLTKAYFYSFGYYNMPRMKKAAPTRNQQVTTQFFNLVQQHFKTQRQVTFYADKMNLTPKYLSACVRETTGHPAIQCIEQHTILYAQNLLSTTNLTISQVSDELHFDSSSTFGKYFRTHVGVGPKEWKATNRS